MADETKTMTPTPPSRPARAAPPVAFAIEVFGSKNESIFWPPSSEALRGRFSWQNVSSGRPEEDAITAMPDLPGVVLTVNSAKRLIKKSDPLNDPANARLLARAQKVGKSSRAVGKKMVPDKTVSREDVSDDELKTAAYWARRLLDVNLVRVIGGVVPDIDAIKAMPGMVNLQTSDTRAGVVHATPNDRLVYRKPLPPDDDADPDREDALPEPVVSADDDGLEDE